jgi:beta-N-acetylhexosaminidase
MVGGRIRTIGWVAVPLLLLAGGLVAILLLGGEETAEPGEALPSAGTRAQAGVGEGDRGLEATVGQLLLAGFDGDAPPPAMRAAIERGELGGVLIRRQNWPARRAGERTVERLEKLAADAPAEPLLTTRQEGGPYRELPDLPPSQREIEIGDKGEIRVAQRSGEETADALRKAGFDLNLAPVADVATLDSPIADRSFSELPDVAAAMTIATLSGCRLARIACAVSHFPGLGGASQDTRQGPATISIDRPGLAERDLLPFRAAIAADVPAIVLSHGLYSSYDPVTPASLSSELIEGLLREQMGFRGVAITDDLEAGAIRAGRQVPEAAVAAIAAGADMVQLGDHRQLEPVRDALVEAVERGEIPSERLEQASGRVLALKRTVGAAPRPEAEGERGGPESGEGGE